MCSNFKMCANISPELNDFKNIKIRTLISIFSKCGSPPPEGYIDRRKT